MLHADIAEHLIQQIKQGAGRWEMPWHKGLPEPFNGVTGKKFRGQNAVVLWAEGMRRGYRSSEWATLRQWNLAGGRVRRGAKGVRLIRPRMHRQADVFGGESENAQGFKTYHVFNYEEVNGVDHEHPDLFAQGGAFAQPNAEAEKIVASSGAVIRFGGDRAFYSYGPDTITMPPRVSFKSTADSTANENFYATLLHELIHWTWQPARCNRKREFDDTGDSYAFEELVAELGAAILTTRLNQLPAPRQQHAAYLQSWLRVLSSDFSYFYKAMRLAQDASDWLCRRAGLLDYLSTADEVDNAVEDTRSDVCEGILVAWAPSGIGFVRLGNAGIRCGRCGHIFAVTLTRYEDQAACDQCGVLNQVEIRWENSAM
ncbi:zincin-like metallopeptidase domain-containing protein [uncultured Halomonas sp.]|uniref:ArdC family protein n=1 Tax=uncultured Halomonas sp. TaxID=173971 RepID=UPI00263A179C|nr:zincin-like metallopeptidase domain-containing protein [uncultured Halomonas sp.]